MVGAATAFAQVLKSPTGIHTATSSASVTPTSSTASIETGLSPNDQANIRRKYLEDLRLLSQLFNDGVLLE